MTEPLRILMTVDAVGGIWTYALDLGRALQARGADVLLAVLGPKPGRQARLAAEETGLRVVELDHPPEWLADGPEAVAAAGEALAALARDIHATVVHLNHPALLAQVDFDQPVLAVCHSCVATWWAAVKGTPLPSDFAWQAELVGRGYRAATALIAPTRAFADATQRAYGLSAAPLVVPNGRKAPAAPAGSPSTARAAVTVGRLWDEGKGASILDRAARLTNIPVFAVGPTSGPNGTSIQLETIEALGARSEAEVRARLSEAPIFVSAALYEPFGLSVLEAAQAGCALVLSDIPTFRELWDGAAIFVGPGDAAGFADALDRLADRADLRGELGRKAQDKAMLYTLETQADRMLTLLQGLAARPVPARASAA